MRIEIRDNLTRNYLFDSVKISFNLSWKGLRGKFGIPKSTLEHYRNGSCFIPESLFVRLIEFLSEADKIKVSSNIEKLPDNFGQVMGGKKAYLINFKKFDEGRKTGLKNIKRYHKIEDSSFKDSLASLQLSHSICQCVGAFIGDGCFNLYNNKLYHIEFAGDRRYDVQYYNELIIPTFKSVVPDLKPHIYSSYGKVNGVRIVFYSKDLFNFFKHGFGFVPGKKAHTIAIPDRIMQSKDELVRATIRGIFDTDGCVFIDKRKSYKLYYPRIALQTVSKDLYNQLVSYLSRHFSLYNTFNEKRQIYIIEIYGINQVKRWMDLIGFSNERHLDRLASVVQR
ncbi:MAG: LAGLIDADG family homing endonuclease [Nanoarchaeota archaeon]